MATHCNFLPLFQLPKAKSNSKIPSTPTTPSSDFTKPVPSGCTRSKNLRILCPSNESLKRRNCSIRDSSLKSVLDSALTGTWAWTRSRHSTSRALLVKLGTRLEVVPSAKFLMTKSFRFLSFGRISNTFGKTGTGSRLTLSRDAFWWRIYWPASTKLFRSVSFYKD